MVSEAYSGAYGGRHSGEANDIGIGYQADGVFGLEPQSIGIYYCYLVSRSFQHGGDYGQTDGWLRVPGELRGIYKSYFKHAFYSGSNIRLTYWLVFGVPSLGEILGAWSIVYLDRTKPA